MRLAAAVTQDGIADIGLAQIGQVDERNATQQEHQAEQRARTPLTPRESRIALVSARASPEQTGHVGRRQCLLTLPAHRGVDVGKEAGHVDGLARVERTVVDGTQHPHVGRHRVPAASAPAQEALEVLEEQGAEVFKVGTLQAKEKGEHVVSALIYVGRTPATAGSQFGNGMSETGQ